MYMFAFTLQARVESIGGDKFATARLLLVFLAKCCCMIFVFHSNKALSNMLYKLVYIIML